MSSYVRTGFLVQQLLLYISVNIQLIQKELTISQAVQALQTCMHEQIKHSNKCTASLLLSNYFVFYRQSLALVQSTQKDMRKT